MTKNRPETGEEWMARVDQRQALAERRGRAKRAAPRVANAETPRPAVADVRTGTPIFDVALGKPIWSNGTAWVDALGNPV